MNSSFNAANIYTVERNGHDLGNGRFMRWTKFRISAGSKSFRPGKKEEEFDRCIAYIFQA